MRDLSSGYEVEATQLKENFGEIALRGVNGKETGEIIIPLKDEYGKRTGLYVKGLKGNALGYDPFWSGYEPASHPEAAVFFLKQFPQAQIVNDKGSELISLNAENDLRKFTQRDTRYARTSISVPPNGNYFLSMVTYGANYAPCMLSTLYSAEGHKLLCHDGVISRDNKEGYVQIQMDRKGVSIAYSQKAVSAEMQEIKQSEFWRYFGRIIEEGVKKDASYSIHDLFHDNKKAFEELKAMAVKTNDFRWEKFNLALAYQKILSGYEKGPVVNLKTISPILGNTGFNTGR